MRTNPVIKKTNEQIIAAQQRMQKKIQKAAIAFVFTIILFLYLKMVLP